MRAALAVVATVVTTTLAAALARAAGVDLEVAGEEIPLSGVAFVTGVCTVVGVLVAAASRRWSAQPAGRFVVVAGSLTAVSLVPPVLADADAATTLTLVALHLVAAAVAVPLLATTLREPSPSPRRTRGRLRATGLTGRPPRPARSGAGSGRR